MQGLARPSALVPRSHKAAEKCFQRTGNSSEPPLSKFVLEVGKLNEAVNVRKQN